MFLFICLTYKIYHKKDRVVAHPTRLVFSYAVISFPQLVCGGCPRHNAALQKHLASWLILTGWRFHLQSPFLAFDVYSIT